MLIVALWAVACARPPATDPELESVAPPDLSQVDNAVREQFDALWRDLESAETGAPARRADAWGALGRWFDVYHYADSAGRCYRNAQRLDPDEPRWPYHLGVLAATAGDLDAAHDHLTKAAELAPEETAPRVRLGDLALDRQQLDLAAELYESVLAGHPDSPGALLGVGRLALLRGEARAALEPLERLVELQPDAAAVRYSLGLARRHLGDDEAADAFLATVPADNLDQIPLVLDAPWDRELQRVDQGARMLTRRGVRAFRRGDPGHAAELLGAAVSADPEGPEKRVNYALALRATGRAGAALEQLETALQLAEPGSEQAARVHLELGRLLAAVARPADAEGHLGTVLEIDPESLAAHLELGRLHHRRGRPERALVHYAAARDGDRPVPETCFWHAAVLTILGRHAEARAALEADLQRLGDDRELSLLLARLVSAAPDPASRDVDRARRLLEAADATPDDASGPDVLYAETAAMVAAADGRFAEAITWQNAAIEVLEGLPRARADHAARRRAALYRNGRRCTTPWEANEALVSLPVSRPTSENRP